MTRAAARAVELADKAVRVSKNRSEFRKAPDAVAQRIIAHIEQIGMLDDEAAGESKQISLSRAWDAYHTVQSYLDGDVADVAWRSRVELVGDESDVLAAADMDGYELSRLNAEFTVTDSDYEGWNSDYSDWN